MNDLIMLILTKIMLITTVEHDNVTGNCDKNILETGIFIFPGINSSRHFCRE